MHSESFDGSTNGAQPGVRDDVGDDVREVEVQENWYTSADDGMTHYVREVRYSDGRQVRHEEIGGEGTAPAIGAAAAQASFYRWWYPIWLGAAGIPLIIGVVFLLIAPGMRAQADHSSFVQAHGTRHTAVILSVNNIENTSTSGTGKNQHTSTSWTAEVTARLTGPGRGQGGQTVIHVPYFDSDAPGTTLTVLVDPNNPGYAELPGTPAHTAVAPTVFTAVGALLVVIAVVGAGFVIRFWLRSVRRRRREAEAAAVTGNRSG
jgi:Protein of unknown function (DUF3592)